MRHVRLKVAEDHATGYSGLVVSGMKIPKNSAVVAREGRLIAHDLVEHVNGIRAIGSIHDELEALGSLWFVRGAWGDISRGSRYGSTQSPERTVAFDVSELCACFVRGVPIRAKVPNTRPLEECDESFEAIIEEARSDALKEALDIMDWSSQREAADTVNTFMNAVMHFMRVGYRKALRRWGKDQMAANSTFWNIADAVELVMRDLDEQPIGMEYRLSYDRYGARCEEIYEEY